MSDAFRSVSGGGFHSPRVRQGLPHRSHPQSSLRVREKSTNVSSKLLFLTLFPRIPLPLSQTPPPPQVSAYINLKFKILVVASDFTREPTTLDFHNSWPSAKSITISNKMNKLFTYFSFQYLAKELHLLY